MIRITTLMSLLILTAIGETNARQIRGLEIELNRTQVERHARPVLTSKAGKVELLRKGLAGVAARDLGATAYSSTALDMKRLAGISKNAPWCAAGGSKWIIEAGHNIKPQGRVDELEKEVRKIAKSTDPEPGAVVFFTWSHVGVLDHVTEDGKFVVIQANCSGAVRSNVQTRRQIRAFYNL